jgi:hypothetical protein
MAHSMTFNTGRRYTAAGQIIHATLHADGRNSTLVSLAVINLGYEGEAIC